MVLQVLSSTNTITQAAKARAADEGVDVDALAVNRLADTAVAVVNAVQGARRSVHIENTFQKNSTMMLDFLNSGGMTNPQAALNFGRNYRAMDLTN